MCPVLFCVYDGLNIHTYGLCILIGIAVCLYCAYQSTWSVTRSLWPLWDTLVLSLAGGVLIGSRLLYWIAQSNHSMISLFSIHEGGFSILGGIIGACIALFIFSIYYKKPYVLLVDLLAIYAPCVQGFARLGCFFAGCCAGAPTQLWWAVWYPLEYRWDYVHPLQIYSALFYLLIFAVFYHTHKRLWPYQGLLGGMYLLISVIERCAQDWLRVQPTFFVSSGAPIDYIIVVVLLALGLSLIAFSYINRRL